MDQGEDVGALPGREHDLASLWRLMREGTVVVLLGPVGVGKTALLHQLARAFRRRGTPCGLVPRTGSLRDFTEALACAYPSVNPQGPQRQIRGRLRRAAEARPGVLLLDHLGDTGTAFKAALKSVRGTGLGVLLAADADEARDRDRIRALCLSHCEVQLRPLHGNAMRCLLQHLVSSRRLGGTVTPAHLRALVAATEGLPGRAVDFANALVDPVSWMGTSPRVDWLRTGAIIRAAERYRQTLEALP
ncbi:MAG TPA: ATP-binding protein [Polyangiaceae bacterium]|jgi:hypothetical protein